MKWYRKFEVDNNTLIDLKLLCNYIKQTREPENNIEQEDCTNDIVLNSTIYVIRNSDPNYSFSNIRKRLKIISGMNLEYDNGSLCIWEYNESFKKCPVHIDYEGGKHTSTLCIALNGLINICLDDDKTHEVLEKVELSGNTFITLNNSRFYHHVEGQGDLIIFGGDVKTVPEEYFA